MRDYKKVAIEIYMLFHGANGSITGVSSKLGKNDSSRFSRQINPNDERRDNFYVELLEVHRALMEIAPELEEAVWKIIERERAAFRGKQSTRRKQTAEHINKLYVELGEVIHKHATGASQEELEKEAFDLIPAATQLYENVRDSGELNIEQVREFHNGAAN